MIILFCNIFREVFKKKIILDYYFCAHNILFYLYNPETHLCITKGAIPAKVSDALRGADA